MKKNSRKKYGNALVTIEIQSIMPEKFLNLIWRNNIHIKNVRKKNITTLVMEVELEDFYVIKDMAKKNKVKIKIIGKRGLTFLLIKFKKNRSLIVGSMLFVGIVYYMSTFLWEIQINTDSSLPPYEIRQKLKNYGIVPGIPKSKVDVYKLEENLMKNDDSIMWVRARIEGSRIVIKVEERKSPPNITFDNTQCDLSASKNGQVVGIYTTAGTPVVKTGDVVKKGQILVSGVQGKEGETYPVHSSGKVICRVSYEKQKTVNAYSIKKKRTGRKVVNYYINLNGKRLYLKKDANKFSKYDKIEESKYFLNKEIFYEVNEVKTRKNIDKLAESTGEELYRGICSNLDKSVKILNKAIESKVEKGNLLKVKLLVTTEEDIAAQTEHIEEPKQKNVDDDAGN